MQYDEAEGLRLTAERTFTEREGYWLISRSNRYLNHRVQLKPKPECTCERFQSTNRWCKHIYALKHHLLKQNAVKETELPKARPQKTYGRDWPKYNQAQGETHREFKLLLNQLCRVLINPEPSRKGGRPRLAMADLMYSAVTKIREYKSGRKMKSSLEEHQVQGYITQIPKASSILAFLGSGDSKELLVRLIGESCMPMRELETSFAIDSTYFNTHRRSKFWDHKLQKAREDEETFKMHISVGIITNIVVAVNVTPNYGEATSDASQFPYLARETAKRFFVKEFLADSAYHSRRDFEIAESLGAELVSTTGKRLFALRDEAFTKSILSQKLRPKEHFERYKKRNNVESAASMMKREYGDMLRSKTDEGLVNEMLCFALIHNLDLLVRAKYELDWEVRFWELR